MQSLSARVPWGGLVDTKTFVSDPLTLDLRRGSHSLDTIQASNPPLSVDWSCLQVYTLSSQLIGAPWMFRVPSAQAAGSAARGCGSAVR
eukprot:4623464-Pyramimonas_sp.AAC.1